jgi:hypothetical protein
LTTAILSAKFSFDIIFASNRQQAINLVI